ncbi:hypothetical protein EP7_000299 [Isosphaeraceae bacterium EP7]
MRLALEPLESRQLLTVPGAIVPGQVYQDVAFFDANGDTVEVKVEGPTGGASGFTLRLSGEATNYADIYSLNLVGLTAANGLNVIVKPNELTINAGPTFNKLFSSGYTSVTSITASNGVTDLGSIHLSAAIVNDIALPGVAIGNITLDTGMVTFVDATNSATMSSISVSAPTIVITSPVTGEAEIYDESPVGPGAQYNPTAGLIDLGDVEARSIGAIVINGSISVATQDPFDVTDTTNDLRGVIDVTGKIGSIVAPRSAMRNAIRAGGIGSIRLGQIDGEITTRDAAEATTVYLPKQFSGFLTTAGHLNIGFTDATAELVTGNIRSGGGISGSDPSETDPILVPDKYAAAVVNTGATKGIASLEFNGSVLSRWVSASSIGNVTAVIFEAGASFEAGSNIGNVEMLMPTAAPQGTATARTPVDLEGIFKAGGNIGNIKSASSVKAEVIAGGNIGTITGVAGGINSTVILAGGNIGDISAFQTLVSNTQISAGGDIGNIRVYSGSVGWKVKAQNIGNVLVDSGSLNLAVFVAAHSLGDVTVTSPAGVAIEGGSLIAGDNIGDVSAYAFAAKAIHGTLIQAGHQAGNRIASVTGISYGSLILPTVTAGAPTSVADDNNGIDAAQILAAEIGPIFGQAYVGTGLSNVVIHAQVGNIAAITGIGNGDGIYQAIVVAEGAIGPITGRSTVLGRGIQAGSFDANGKFDPDLGTIGQITAQGGPAGGAGINGATRIQASGRIAGIDSTANANGGDAINALTAYATSFGQIKATVLGGQLGNGIVDANFRAWSDYENQRPDVQIDGIDVDVRSGLGLGISNTIFKVKGDITSIKSRALNASAISGGTFDLTQGDIGRIYAESVNSGNAIQNSLFTASNGSIGSARTLADALTSGITAIASGTSVLANGIVGSIFSADGNIGFINATTRGGTAISGSSFTADSDYGNAKNGPNLPGTVIEEDDFGALFGIYAKTSGQYLAQSAAISGSTFSGELISSITVDVTDREEGGPGISGSSFTASNAVYDNKGNFNNRGAIGPITVTNGSLRGNGIEASEFNAGAAGSIGDITVTVLGGSGITESEFRASIFDYDQSSYNSTIGNIRVTTGRSGSSILPVPQPPNDAWSLVPAGIDTSYFAANGGIGNVDVNSIGTGIFFSAFLASFDAATAFGSIPGFILPLLAENTPGNLGNVTITSTGRFGFGSALSVYAGDSVGNINIRVASRDTTQATPTLPNLTTGLVGQALQKASNKLAFTLGSLIGPAGSAASAFIALNGNIGSVSVTNAGAGYGSIASAYVALPVGFYGPVTLSGHSFLNLFWALPRFFAGPTTTATSIDGRSTGLGTLGASQTVSASATSATGESPSFKVNFSNAVDVVGQPWFVVNVGSATRLARYVSGSGTSQLVFKVKLEAGDSGDVTIAPGTSIGISLTDRIVEGSTGYLVTQLSPAAIYTGGVPVDTQAPVITSVSPIQSPAKRYAVGQKLTYQVTFSEAVTVQGLPTILLTFKNLKRSLVYSGGSGTNTLLFTYKLTRADVATGKAAVTNGRILLPAGASISDGAGNVANLPVASAVVALGTAETKKVVPIAQKKQVVVRPKSSHPKGPVALKKGIAVAGKSK